jgi:hypothetical protein
MSSNSNMSSVRNREDESSSTTNDEIFSLTFGELRTATREALRELSRKQRRVIVEFLRGIDATFEYPFMNDSTDYATERNFLSLITNCINSFPSRFDDEACQVSRGTITKLFGAIASAAASPVGDVHSQPQQAHFSNERNFNGRASPVSGAPAQREAGESLGDASEQQPRAQSLVAGPSSQQPLGESPAMHSSSAARRENLTVNRRARREDEDDVDVDGGDDDEDDEDYGDDDESSEKSSDESDSNRVEQKWWLDDDQLPGQRIFDMASESIIPPDVMKHLRKAYKAEGAIRFKPSSFDFKLSESTKKLLGEIKKSDGCAPPPLGPFKEKLSGADAAREEQLYERAADMLVLRTLLDAAVEIEQRYGKRGRRLVHSLRDACR